MHGQAALKAQIAVMVRSRYAIPLTLVVALQLLVLASIRHFAADPSGGDLCRDVVAVHRLLASQNPYLPITTCGVLRHTPHTPASLLLITPFMVLPVGLAALVWDVFALLALGLALALIAAELGARPRPWHAALMLAFVAVWPPLLNTLLEAQISPLLLLLFVLTWRWARHGKSASAGIALGLATALRLFPALLVVYFALRRDWRAVGAAVAACAASSLVLLPFVGPGAYWDFATREAPAVTADWIANQHNTSLAGLAYSILGADSGVAPLAGRLLTLALLVGLVTLTWVHRTHASSASTPGTFAFDEATFVAYIPAALLATPILWLHYFVVLLLPLAVLAARLGWLGTSATPIIPAPRRLLITWLAVACLVLVEVGYALQQIAFPRPLGWLAAIVVDGPPTYALLALLLALLLAGSVAQSQEARTMGMQSPALEHQSR